MLDLSINGNISMDISEMDGKDVSPEVEKDILEKLQKTEYIISIAKKEIYNLKKSFSIPIYKFEISPMDNLEYNFDFDFDFD